jgi:hypothetical protein
MNFVRMNGSTDPPHDFRLYIPEHRCRFASSCFYVPVSSESPMVGVGIQAAFRYLQQLRQDMPVLPA